MATAQNRVFFSQQALDLWLSGGKVDLRGTQLTILEERRSYQIAEAVYIMREVSGAADAHDLIGRVKPKARLEREGAEIFDSSLVFGDNAYDVVPGWLGAPASSFEEHIADSRRAGSGDFTDDEPKTDEDLLARFVLKSLK